jgi:hypothetical protein
MAVAFTPTERAEPFMEVWQRDAVVRSRFLQYVAEAAGISTSGAHELVESRLLPELGVFPGSANPATLGQVLDHLAVLLKSMGKGEQAMLDQPVTMLSDDPGACMRVIRCIELQAGLSFVDAHARLMAGVDVVSMERGPKTVRAALDAVGCAMDVDEVAADLRLLESRDEELAGLYRLDAAPLEAEHVDNDGQVLLDASADAGAMIADPVERERRWQRAKRVGWDDRGQFDDDDRRHLDAGIDLVRSAERRVEIVGVRGRQAVRARQLDQAVESARDAKSRVRALDAQIAELRGQRGAAAAVVPPIAAAVPGLRLLDGDDAASGPEEGASPLREITQLATEICRDRGWCAGAVRDFDRALDLVKELRPDLWEQSWELSAAPVPPGDAGSRLSPVGGHPEDLNQRILQQLSEQGRPMSDYPNVLAEMMSTDPRGNQTPSPGQPRHPATGRFVRPGYLVKP